MKQHNTHQTLFNIIFHHVQQTDEIAELMAEEEANRIKLPEILSNYSLKTSAGKRKHSSSKHNIVRHYDFEEVLQTIRDHGISIHTALCKFTMAMFCGGIICHLPNNHRVLYQHFAVSAISMYDIIMNPSINLSIIEKQFRIDCLYLEKNNFVLTGVYA